jgi:pantoate--beta-alanine ligase
MHIHSLKEAKSFIASIKNSGETIGSVHTLGALHRGHGILIQQSAQENQHTIVTVYPNKIQLFPGLKYKFDLEADVQFALDNGATAVISSTDEEMFPSDYRTYIDQGISHSRLNSSVFSYASRGQVTGSIRWINFTQPTRSYFGLKDIEQAILVKRAVDDLLINTEIVHVPSIRLSNGVPISSRLLHHNNDVLTEVGLLYKTLTDARLLIAEGQNNATEIIKFIKAQLSNNVKIFTPLYVTIVDPVDFLEVEQIKLPFIIHAAIQHDKLTHFDGLWIRSEADLKNGPPIIWL